MDRRGHERNQWLSNLAHGEEYSIHLYMMKFISDLWPVLRFPPAIKLTATI